MGSFHDSVGHYARVFAQAFPFPNDAASTPAAITNQTANLGYSLIRPPGYGAGATTFQPQCGAGPSGLDPTQDPEAGR
jgi:hypothetical protein